MTELDRKLLPDRPPQPPYLQPHLWGPCCRSELLDYALQTTRQTPLFFDQFVESTEIIFGLGLIRQFGISEQTFYRWKKEYAGLEPDQAREFKQLADENARLKKLVAE